MQDYAAHGYARNTSGNRMFGTPRIGEVAFASELVDSENDPR